MAFLCGTCNEEFDSVPALCTHIRFRHPESLISPYRCGNCPRRFSTLRALRKHLNRDHSQREPFEDQQNIDEQVAYVENNVPVDIAMEIQEAQVERRIENDRVVTVYDFKKALYDSALALSAKLYSRCTLNRSQVQEIIDMVSDFTGSGFLDVLHQKMLSVFGNRNDHQEQIKDLNEMFEALQDSFVGLKTEKLRMYALEQSDAYIRPQKYVIGVGEEIKYVNGNAVITPTELTGQFISMKKVLKRFFELPGILNATLNNIENLRNSNDFTNVIQSPLWRDIEETHFTGRTVFPLFFYYDDAEPDNQTGSHAGCHKLGTGYYEIPCIPEHLNSSLENIFVACVFLSSDRQANVNAAFQPVVNELRDLETDGIIVQVDGIEHRIFFALAAILGDNLGIQTISGFVESFSAHYFCRICKVRKGDTQSQTRENLRMLRTPENYARDLLLNDYSSTGIKRECQWNTLTSYHVTVNTIVDLMHDFLEGVCHYDLCAVLSRLIGLGFFNVATLNERVKNFDYNFDAGNKPNVISADHIRNEKLRMSASEMSFFVRHLGLMIGDLVPENNEFWKLYLYLVEILSIVTAPYVRGNSLAYLATLIAEHHEVYLNVFNKTLKPKYHMMVHYPRIMEKVGPVIHLWSMRMEAKHRPIVKQSARSHTSRKNLPLTTAVRYSLSLSARILAKTGFPEDAVFHSEESHLGDLTNVDEFINILPPGFNENSIFVKEATIKGTVYKRNMVLVTNYDNDLPVFARIESIAKPLEIFNKAWFLLSRLKTHGFSYHLQCFEVERSGERLFLAYEDLVSFYPSVCRTGADGRTYVMFRHVL